MFPRFGRGPSICLAYIRNRCNGSCCAANIIFKKDEDKDAKTAKYVEEFATPYKAAERGFVDVVIEPKQTRPAVINALAMLARKRANRAPKKHGNIPL